MKVIVDRGKCTGVGNCVAVAPDVFELDDENKAIVIDISSAGEDTLWRAAKGCPKDAVILEDDEGNRLYP